MFIGLLEVVIIFLLIVANGMFSMSEIAIISARKARLQQSAEEGSTRAAAALDLANEPNLFLSTVQIGITLIGVLSGALGGVTVADQLAGALSGVSYLAPYSGPIALTVVVAAITFFSLVIGELVPKRIALNDPERIASLVASPMRGLSVAAYPVIRLLSGATDVTLRLLGARPSAEPPVTEEEIKVLIEQGTMAGVFDEAEQDMVGRVFRLADRRAGVLMTPRKKITWLDLNEPVDKVRRKITKSVYSRFPVCQGRLGNILGVVHVRDLLARTLLGQTFNLKACLQQPLFVHENMHALKVLELFRESGSQMALVIDEYGTIEGLVTLNDMLEAIVGDFPSIDDTDEPKVVQRDDGSWLVDGMLPADEVKELFDLKRLPGERSGHYQTLGGFVMTYLKRVPATGDRFECCGLRFEVLDMDGQRVDKVLIERLRADPTCDDTVSQ